MSTRNTALTASLAVALLLLPSCVEAMGADTPGTDF